MVSKWVVGSAGRGGTPPRGGEKCAQQIDCKGVGELPLCRYGCNQLNLRDLEVTKQTKNLAELNHDRLNVELFERLNVGKDREANQGWKGEWAGIEFEIHAEV